MTLDKKKEKKFLFIRLLLFIIAPVFVSSCDPGNAQEVGQQADGKIVAMWELNWLQGTKLKNVLIYRDGKMINSFRAPDMKKKVSQEWFERPSQNPSERKFDTAPPDCETCDYVTISKSGIIKYFGWDGHLQETVLATFINPDAMNIGNNPRVKPCTPKKLLPASLEALRLYNQLQEFKDDPRFIQMGFSQGGPYYSWIKAVQKLNEDAIGVFGEVSFFPGDLLMLGTAYVVENGSEIERLEKTIQAGLAQAECR